MSIELKIKSKHLALEPAIIKHEERKLRLKIKYLKQLYQVNDDWHSSIYPFHAKYWSLVNHRKTDVRNEARATYLARAYLKGIPYKKIEAKCDPFILHKVIVPRIMAMVAKYGPKPIRKYHYAGGYDYRPEEKARLLTEITNWVSIE